MAAVVMVEDMMAVDMVGIDQRYRRDLPPDVFFGRISG
jgi:hypothetical protein